MSKDTELPLSHLSGLNHAEKGAETHQPSALGVETPACLLRRFLFCDGAQWIALLLTVFAIAPLAYPGFFQSHSGLLPIYHLYDLESRSALSLPAWTETIGQSFDPFRAGRSLPYLAAEFFRWLRLSAPEAIMSSFALSFLVAAWAMYRWAQNWLGSEAALLAATIYTYFPYHLTVVYARGALAEAWLLALLPVTFWAASGLGMTRRESVIPRRQRTLSALLTLAAFGLLCLTHLGLALMCGPILIGYIWLGGGLSGRWGPGAALAAVFATTLIAHLAAGRDHARVAFEAHFPYLFQLLSPAWNVNGQTADWLNGLPLQIGLPSLGLTFLTIILLTKKIGPEEETPISGSSDLTANRGTIPAQPNRRLLWYWLIVAGLALILMWSPLSFLWQWTGWRYFLTYPWQMLGPLGLCLAVFAGAVVTLDARLQTVMIRLGLVTLVVLSSYGYLVPRFFDFNIDFTPEGKSPHVYSMTPRRAPLAIFGDNQVALLDLRLEGPLRHGATVRLNALWQALRPLEDDFMVFVHASDDSGSIWGQRDVELVDGERLASQWGEGEIVAGRYEFQIGLDGPREGYHLEIGLYHPTTGERLFLADGAASLLVRGE